MKPFIASLFALGLAAGSTTAHAQSRYDRPYDSGYGDYRDDAQGEAYVDEARVIRVDPVLEDGYRPASGSGVRCYDTTTAGRYEPDGYEVRSRRYDDGYDARRPGTEGPGRSVATIAGGVIGAVLGSQVGGGSGQVVATTVGTMVGGLAGREIYDQQQRNRYVRGGTVRVCDPEPVRSGDRRAGGYDVTYEYNGRRYTRRMDYHPGDRVRVRVTVVPD